MKSQKHSTPAVNKYAEEDKIKRERTFFVTNFKKQCSLAYRPNVRDCIYPSALFAISQKEAG
jgi:hypothetical protein